MVVIREIMMNYFHKSMRTEQELEKRQLRLNINENIIQKSEQLITQSKILFAVLQIYLEFRIKKRYNVGETVDNIRSGLGTMTFCNTGWLLALCSQLCAQDHQVVLVSCRSNNLFL